jgi:hypothetical protein
VVDAGDDVHLVVEPVAAVVEGLGDAVVGLFEACHEWRSGTWGRGEVMAGAGGRFGEMQGVWGSELETLAEAMSELCSWIGTVTEQVSQVDAESGALTGGVWLGSPGDAGSEVEGGVGE